MHCGGDPGVAKVKTVLNAAAFGLGSKSRHMEGSVQEIPGTISSEHTSCTVRAMRARRQTKNQQSGRCIAERRHRFTPVIPIAECTVFRDGDFAAMADQARAALTFHDLPAD